MAKRPSKVIKFVTSCDVHVGGRWVENLNTRKLINYYLESTEIFKQQVDDYVQLSM